MTTDMQTILNEWETELDEKRRMREAEDRERKFVADIMQREWDAAFRTEITFDEAKRDLRIHPRNPFLFRKYMRIYWERMTKEWEQSYPVLSEAQKARIRVECGRELQKLVGPGDCGRENWREYAYDPEAAYTFTGETGLKYHVRHVCDHLCGPPISAHTGGDQR